jgi:hypothetical protein
MPKLYHIFQKNAIPASSDDFLKFAPEYARIAAEVSKHEREIQRGHHLERSQIRRLRVALHRQR